MVGKRILGEKLYFGMEGVVSILKELYKKKVEHIVLIILHIYIRFYLQIYNILAHKTNFE